MTNKVFVKVGAAMVLAVVAGALTPDEAWLCTLYALGGQLFLNALTLMVVPLVVSSIITGTARIGNEHSFGALGLRTLGAYLLTMTLAVIVGWLVAVVIAPGVGFASTSLVSGEVSHYLQQVEAQGEHALFAPIAEIFLNLVPSNILAVASEGQILGLIVFSIVFGLLIPKVEENVGEMLMNFWSGIFQVMMLMTHLVMRALPLGVFCLVAKIVASTGLESVKPISLFFVTATIALGLYALVVLPAVMRLILGVSPWRLIRAMMPALLTALSTSSSATTLPITIDCIEKRASVSNRICSFVVPLATTLNLSGSALFNCVSVFFICQIYHIQLHIGMQFFIAFLSLITAFGIAGIPSAGIITIIMILNTLGLPSDGVALILTVERFLDMLRTSVNVFSNSCCAIMIAKTEGEYDVLSSRA